MTSPPPDYDIDFNTTNTTLAPDLPLTFPPSFHLLIYTLYNLIFLTAVAGNVLVIYVVLSSTRMRTVTNYLIANLALGDLLMALLCVPFSYISVLLQYWPFGEILCHLVSPAQAVCVFVSAYTLVVLAVDRYLAILYPLRLRLTRKEAIGVIFGVWVVALITAAPIAVFTRLEVDEKRGDGLPLCEESAWSDDNLRLAYSLTLMILQYFFPISVLIFTYTRIALAVWGKKAPGEAEDNRDQRLARAKRKTVTTTLFVVSTYTLAWLPLNLFQLCLATFPAASESFPNIEVLFISCHWLAMAHTTFNPVIYAWTNKRFREGFKRVFYKVEMIKMMLTVVIIYTVSWLPFNILILLLSTLPQTHPIFASIPQEDLAIIYFLCHFLAISHTVVNPVIYSSMNSRFRQGFAIATRRIGCLSRLFYDFEQGGGSTGTRLQRGGTVTCTYSFNNQQQGNGRRSSGRRNVRNNKNLDESFI